MSIIDVSGLTFAYEGSYDNIFEDVNLTIHTDWKLGLIGRNGRGKTTLLMLLQNKYDYSGTITSPAEFMYFPFEIKDGTVLTIDIVNSVGGDYEHWRLLRELSLLRVGEDVLYRPFDTLSKGEQTKVMLCVLFLGEDRFLLIDEPTNHLDMEGRELVADYLNSKSGFILVSHDRNFLDACVDHIISINRSDIELIQGNFSSWYENSRLRDEFELEENTRLKKEIKRLSKTATEKADWSDRVEATKIGGHAADRGRIGHLAAKMMKRSKAIEKRVQREVEHKKSLLKNIEQSDDLKIHPLMFHNSKLFSMRDLSLFYGDKMVCDGLRIDINVGDRIAVQGRNGSGKSSIIKLLCGGDIKYSGTVNRASGIKISYVPQDSSFLCGSFPDFEQEHSLDVTLFRAILRKLGFLRVQFEKTLENLSEGQKKKVLIAKSLSERAHLYIWDEPLNYIDLISRMQVENLLLSYKPTIVFVEHDREFCESIATKVLQITG